MSVRNAAIWVSLFLSSACGMGCGYLDNDIFVDDETYAQEMEFEGLSISGYGYSGGCGGGYGTYRHGTRRIRIGKSAIGADPSGQASLSDAELLNATDIEMIDESEDELGAQPGLVEYVYYSQKQDRDAAIAEVY